MEYRNIGKDSQYLWYIIDNESQLADMAYLFDRFGGHKVYSAEFSDCVDDHTRGIFYFSVFIVVPPDPYRIRVFMGHGISDKPIAKFKPPRNYTAMDYYNTPGLKFSWHYDHYGHQIQVPYDKRLKFGLPTSDLFLNPLFDYRGRKEEFKKSYGINTDRPIILFSPSFNSNDLEFYFRLFVESFKDDYYFIVRSHDREFFFDKYPFPNVFHYRGLEHPAELIACADYYIGDGSSVDNIAIYADIPMVLVKDQVKIRGDVPYEFDMRNYMPYFAINPDGPFKSITDCIKESEGDSAAADRQAYIDKSFDFNDGKCIDRMCQQNINLLDILKRRMAGERDTRNYLLVNIWNQTMPGRTLQEMKTPDDINYDDLYGDCLETKRMEEKDRGNTI